MYSTCIRSWSRGRAAMEWGMVMTVGSAWPNGGWSFSEVHGSGNALCSNLHASATRASTLSSSDWSCKNTAKLTKQCVAQYVQYYILAQEALTSNLEPGAMTISCLQRLLTNYLIETDCFSAHEMFLSIILLDRRTLELTSSAHCHQCFGSLGAFSGTRVFAAYITASHANSNVHWSNKTTLRNIPRAPKWSGLNRVACIIIMMCSMYCVL